MKKYIISYISEGELCEEVVGSLEDVALIIGPNGTEPNAKALVFEVWSGYEFSVAVHARQP